VVGLLVGWGIEHETFSDNVLLGLPIVLVAVGALAWAQLRRPGSAAARQRRCLEPSRVVE